MLALEVGDPGIPGDIEFGTFGLNPGVFGTADLTATGAIGLGQVVVSGSEAWVVVNGDFDLSFAPRNPGRIGKLVTNGNLP